jgi:hypothetical protein
MQDHDLPLYLAPVCKELVYSNFMSCAVHGQVKKPGFMSKIRSMRSKLKGEAPSVDVKTPSLAVAGKVSAACLSLEIMYVRSSLYQY